MVSLSLSLGLGAYRYVTPATPTMASSVTYEGITYSFYDAATGGALKTVAIYTGAEGQPNVVADAATYMQTDVPSAQINSTFTASRYNSDGSSTALSLSATPLWAHGMMKNPMLFDGDYLGVGLAQGFDEMLAYSDTVTGSAPSAAARSVWDAAKNVDPGYTGTRVQLVEGSYVKTKRTAGLTTSATYRTFDNISVLHVLPAVPAVGFFSPAIAKTSKAPVFFASQRDKTALGSGFTVPSGKITLAAAETAGYFTRGVQPYFGQNGEKRRRYMIIDSDLSGIGYSRDYGQLWNDWLTGLLALGSSAPDVSLNRALSFGINLVGQYEQAGFTSEGGAGQSNGHKQFVQLVGHVFNGVSGLAAKCIAFNGNFTYQPKKVVAGDVGLAVGFPDGNHEVFYRPWGTEHIGQYGWQDQGISSSEFDQDYETTSGIASFGELLNAATLKNWPGGLDGSQVLDANYPGAVGYYDLLRTIPEIYSTTVTNPRDDNFYDAIRSTWAVGIKAQKPNTASQVDGVSAGASSFTWDYSAMGHSPETVTGAETQYSLDGIIWSTAASGLTGTASSLVPGWRYYTRRRRQSASGWGAWSYNVKSGNQSVTAKASGTTAAGSSSITMTITAGSPSVRVGDLIAGPGVTPGSYIVSFGTGTGAAGNTGTYNLSMPAYEAVSEQQFRMAPMPAMVTPTGTPSGTVTWTTNPAIYRSTYATNLRTPLFTAAALDGSDTATGDVLFCGMGIATGAVQAPTFQWKRNGVNISGATAQGYRRAVADNGTTLTCTVTSNGQSATTAGIVVPGAAYPAFDQVTFDGTNDYITRTTPAAFTGAANGKQLTIALPIQMLAGDGVLKRIFAWGDAAGTASTDNIIQLDRTTTNLLTLTLRTAANATAFSVTTTAGLLNVAAGKKLLMISLDLATSAYHIYLDNTAATLGTVTNNNVDIGIGSIQRPQTMTPLSGLGAATVNAGADYLFMHPGYIDLTVQGNRDKFAAGSAGIGNLGDAPFGTSPLFFMYGTAADWNAGTNWGSGGNVNMVGAVT